MIAKLRAIVQQQFDVRYDNGAAVPVDGMVQLLVDFPQTIGNGSPLPFG